MSLDLGAAYREARLRIAALVSDEVGDLPVAATPGWNLHDVVAHVTGVADDATAGNMAGAPGEAWTAAQVARGAGRTVAEMVDGWHEKGPFVEMFLSSPEGASRAAAVFDIHTHECDLLTALGRPISVPADVLAWIGESFREGFARQVGEAGLPSVSVELSDLELFRSRLGRRTADEVGAYGWSADPAPYLDHWFVFGVAERSLGERTA
ncbi:MAG: hypothetical protein NTZ21_07680 [Actinobacteria bacterium]|nr:hypothetical protein [Actinomycetota bacterium]